MTPNLPRLSPLPEMRQPLRRRLKPRPPLDVTVTPLPGGLGISLDLGRLLWDLEVQETLRELGMR
ncbi:hypothetical protein [Hymenobacter properus]|uniref:Uncharacterized protein n=1 Tax=Hymenobacter properus TaxID=2791026 RepID=A0A931BEJ2_9BACT|nr:hypothetical protein [Hymenobacter properus]MBF9140837.1 hypothetical protein [Hymenobacter properus]MBR7719646.1 hypothetical protein [Microvirga sp. SRT04]